MSCTKIQNCVYAEGHGGDCQPLAPDIRARVRRQLEKIKDAVNVNMVPLTLETPKPCDYCGTKGPCERHRIPSDYIARLEAQASTAPLYTKRDHDNALRTLQTIWELHSPGCQEAECMICGVLACPSYEPLHFHGDGCPAMCGR